MARKDLLKSVMAGSTEQPKDSGRSGYAMRGASKSMKVSIDSLAENSKRLLEGETIVDIDPQLIDVSFVSDRLSDDDVAFDELKASIAAGRQDTPVLLRPHPEADGRYMIVFGHRRVRVASALGRKVRAVVKPMDDVAHILAQGQENTARADLSFIEKALFAKSLLDMGQAKDVIQSALTIDGTLLSRMLSVAQNVPRHVIEQIGPAKQIGRDRWEDFKKLASEPSNDKILEGALEFDGFQNLDSDARFEFLHSRLTEAGRVPKRRKARATPKKRTWTAGKGRIKGVIGRSGKAFSISLTEQDSTEFGDFLSGRLDQLYSEFLSTKKEEQSEQ
ncbi:plasmid partitioning protein RepB [Phaeobacter gallaeciensis]|uniref:Plasmid partitioning protein RepB n=2 Tax=Roseobacteraceae TaxID=2854170 RepID=A0ABD4XDT5_9RHOB|nr:plasmid partitioning protein RepB [Phaeobacter gallaeciensis]MDE4142133.1 plasmid partitioning protein RepB [Phaeobacter gallaeciensis]MDE4146553.1 plasmid partitioning protein RepB [Phaeobacter gallaeciensis]MDE4150626.1 plasmid partitioning protein RepB [Phaeobacter gallaeciensis]MDE4154804.1 plasmid partitioning protein RepB [Phaeobacter gallaeciensis]MDE4159306.1 plasmid partitioning protein RepB [Phaeobacter gallaeciensis]